MITIVYPVRIKMSNLGDVLINVLLVRELSKHCHIVLDGRNDVLLKLSTKNNPFANNIVSINGSEVFYGKPVLRWINLWKILNEINYVLDPPGHYSTGRRNGKSYLKSIKYIFRALVLKIFNIKVVRLGVTMGPFTNIDTRFQRIMCSLYDSIAVRDLKNFNTLKKLNFDNIKLIDDLAFLYNPEDFLDSSYDILQDNKDIIVISFRTSIEGNDVDELYMQSVSKTLKHCLSELPKVSATKILVTYQVEEDLNSFSYLQTILDELSFDYELVKDRLQLFEALKIYNRAKFVFTNRLHVALLALLNNTTTIIVTDIREHAKIVNIFNDWQLNNMILDINTEKDIDLLFENDLSEFKLMAKNKREKISSILHGLFKL